MIKHSFFSSVRRSVNCFPSPLCGLDVRDISDFRTLEETVYGYTELHFCRIGVYFCLMNTDVNMIICNLIFRKFANMFATYYRLTHNLDIILYQSIGAIKKLIYYHYYYLFIYYMPLSNPI